MYASMSPRDLWIDRVNFLTVPEPGAAVLLATERTQSSAAHDGARSESNTRGVPASPIARTPHATTRAADSQRRFLAIVGVTKAPVPKGTAWRSSRTQRRA